VEQIRSYLAQHGKKSLGQITAQEVAQIIDNTQTLLAKKPRTPKTAKPADDELWLTELEGNPAYAGIDIRRELGKCQVWCETNRQACSRARFVNWLNKADRNVGVSGIGQSSFRRQAAPVGLPEPQGWREWLRVNRPDSVYAPGNEHGNKPWSAIDLTAQRYISEQISA
jgi:hypothetical protein